ncbi:MAG: hypothetical protein ACI4JC_01050 [Faecalibacterium sp.]
MDTNGIRVGKISSVEYDTGMVRVVYHDQDDAVSRPIPLLSFEYLMPEVDDQVLVLHLSNGTEAGIVIGRPWSGKRKPPESGEGLYRKDFSNEFGKAYLRFAMQDDEKMTLHVKNLVIEADSVAVQAKKDFTVEASGSITAKAAQRITLTAPAVTIDSPEVALTGKLTVADDATASGISVATHKHMTPSGISGIPQ